MTTLRYALHPDFVISKNDGQAHYIGHDQLAWCYRLDPDQYIVIDDRRDRHTYAKQMRRAEELGLIHLYPRFDGNYTLPT